MSLLDDARALADLYPITEVNGFRFHDHGYCGGGGDCPHFALPRIVAALEAAERVAEASNAIDLDSLTDEQEWDSTWQSDTLEHQFIPAVRALVAALKGEVVPSSDT